METLPNLTKRPFASENPSSLLLKLLVITRLEILLNSDGNVSKTKVYILNRFAGDNPNYTSWMSECPHPCEIIDEYSPEWSVAEDAGVLVTHMHYRWEEISTLRRVYETTQVPILILADGILEFRNTWENPGVADGACFQPLMGHKLACIGRAQARTIESWGNVGSCEVVGLPKFDEAQKAEYLPVQNTGPFRILVATANTPAFNSQQRALVLESLRAIKHRFENNPWVNQRKLEITWRLTDGLGAELGIAGASQKSGKKIPISDAIELADAVITTPSTLYLESVMKRRPTAILDFTNSPQYVGSAWTISAPIHLNTVLQELENPPAPKLLFQRSVLHDNLELGVSSKSRLFGLINEMIKAGQAAKRNGNKLSLPTRILSDPQRGIQAVEAEFNASILYRDNPSFQIGEVERLRQELSQAVARLGQLPRDLDTKHAGNQVLAKQLSEAEARVRAGLERANRNLEMVEWKSEVIVKKSEHIDSLQKLFVDNTATIKSLRAELQNLKIENQKYSEELANQPEPVSAGQSVSPMPQADGLQVPSSVSPTDTQRLPRIQMPSTFPISNANDVA